MIPIYPLLRPATWTVLTFTLVGCSGSATPAENGVGGVGQGGSAMGGSSSGGAATGGTAIGGASTGGAATGGASKGGAAAGGLAMGGLATGGAATGGASNGGAAAGGIATGGAATGGLATGGLATGGLATGGGSAIGGAASGGTATAGSSAVTTTTVSYTVDTSTVFANPERGFYHHEETHSNSHVALNAQALSSYRTSEAITLILRLYYLESFRNNDISASYLSAISSDLAAVRGAGLKAILRFAYTDSMTAPYGDASRARVVGHIAQLTSLLQQNADIVFAVQAGFVGAWGEWYYTDYFGDLGQISAAQWDDRRAVVDAWLAALPSPRTVALRTPAFKRHFFGAAALSESEAFTTASKSRVGHHNDCFLASSDDQGTYDDVTADKAYLAAETLYVPQGGETCATSSYSDWSHASSDMAMLHYTYLNRDYNTAVLGSWGTNLDTARRLLGYRLALVSGTYGTTAAPGSGLAVSFTLRNDGYAAPLGPRGFDVLLRHETTNAVYRAQLTTDPRRFVPGAARTVNTTLCVPASMTTGSYRLLLALPDPAPALKAQAAYAIRLANTGLWEANTGYHDLQHRVTIAANGQSAACDASSVSLIGE